MKTGLLLISVVLCSHAAVIPRTLVSADEADPIHSAIIRKEAWTLAPVKRLRAEVSRQRESYDAAVAERERLEKKLK